MSTPAQITIRPDHDRNVMRYPSSDRRLAGERLAFGTPAAPADARFFGEDGLGITDVVDAINPLNHIPFISTLYQEATGTAVSSASRLVGGALLGGPIGFLAALGNIIFEQETGHSMGGAMVAGIMGDDPATTQVAQAASPAPTAATLAENPIAVAALPSALPAPVVAEQGPPTGTDTTPVSAAVQAQDQAVLGLFGSHSASAHASYRKAQFAPYLTDVTTSQLL